MIRSGSKRPPQQHRWSLRPNRRSVSSQATASRRAWRGSSPSSPSSPGPRVRGDERPVETTSRFQCEVPPPSNHVWSTTRTASTRASTVRPSQGSTTFLSPSLAFNCLIAPSPSTCSRRARTLGSVSYMATVSSVLLPGYRQPFSWTSRMPLATSPMQRSSMSSC